MKYFYKNRIVNFDFALDAKYDVGTTYEDNVNGKYVKLTKKQLTFLEANPNVSVLEVYNCALNTVSAEQQLLNAKYRKLCEIEQADKASEVFYINQQTMWLDKNTRTSLIANTIPALKANNADNTTLWTEQGNIPIAITISIAALEAALNAIEIYAKQTYDIMQQHKAQLARLSTIEEINAFAADTDYPNFLDFTI